MKQKQYRSHVPSTERKASCLISFLGLQQTPLGAVSGSEAGLGPGDAVHLQECCPWLTNGLQLGAKAGFRRGGFANTGRLQSSAKAGLEATCKQALKGLSPVCTIPGAETGLPRLLLLPVTEHRRAAEGQGGATGTASCWCQKNSVEAACSKGKACLCLSAEGSVHIPSIWLTGEKEACWEVQNWVKTLPDWLDDGIWFWLSSYSKSTFTPDTLSHP